MDIELFRVEDNRAENDGVPVPICKFCSKPMIRLPKTDKIGAGYACNCARFQSYIRKDIELQKYQKALKELEQRIITLEQEMSNLGRHSDYYKLVEDTVRKNMTVKNKTKKEKVVSFGLVKDNKERMDKIKAETENYYFYPYLL